MSRPVVFNQVTLDGYFSGTNGDISWAHRGSKDAEFDAFVEGNAKGGGVLVFGRITYEPMARYWPTPQALENDPIVAERMNQLPKVVFSRTLDKASWNNTKLVKRDMAAGISSCATSRWRDGRAREAKAGADHSRQPVGCVRRPDRRPDGSTPRRRRSSWWDPNPPARGLRGLSPAAYAALGIQIAFALGEANSRGPDIRSGSRPKSDLRPSKVRNDSPIHPWPRDSVEGPRVSPVPTIRAGSPSVWGL